MDAIERASRILCRKDGIPVDRWPHMSKTFVAAHFALQLTARDLVRGIAGPAMRQLAGIDWSKAGIVRRRPDGESKDGNTATVTITLHRK